jgi:hypothetical protein
VDDRHRPENDLSRSADDRQRPVEDNDRWVDDPAPLSDEGRRRLDAIRRELELEFDAQVAEGRPEHHSERSRPAQAAALRRPGRPGRQEARPPRRRRGAGAALVATFVLGGTVGGVAAALLVLLAQPPDPAQSTPPRASRPGGWAGSVTARFLGRDDERARDELRRALGAWAGAAEISLDGDGRTATTRLRRPGSEGDPDGSDEAIVVLRWIRTVDGWTIAADGELESGSKGQ